jgi:hypothetical protein
MKLPYFQVFNFLGEDQNKLKSYILLLFAFFKIFELGYALLQIPLCELNKNMNI